MQKSSGRHGTAGLETAKGIDRASLLNNGGLHLGFTNEKHPRQIGLEADTSILVLGIETLHEQKDSTIDKLIECNHSAVVTACEQRIQKIELDIAATQEKIANCGRPLGDFDEKFRTAIEFLAEPHKLWASDDYEHKRAVLRMGFSEPLVYHRNEGFRTACKSSPFRLIEGFHDQKGEVVDHSGKSLNHLFDILAEWNVYLEQECPDIYSMASMIKLDL